MLQVGTKSGTKSALSRQNAHKSAKSRQKLRRKTSQLLKISQLALSKVPRADIAVSVAIVHSW